MPYFKFQNYPKLSMAYYNLLEVITQDHVSFIISLPAAVVYHILETITSGLTALGIARRFGNIILVHK